MAYTLGLVFIYTGYSLRTTTDHFPLPQPIDVNNIGNADDLRVVLVDSCWWGLATAGVGRGTWTYLGCPMANGGLDSPQTLGADCTRLTFVAPSSNAITINKHKLFIWKRNKNMISFEMCVHSTITDSIRSWGCDYKHFVKCHNDSDWKAKRIASPLARSSQVQHNKHVISAWRFRRDLFGGGYL